MHFLGHLVLALAVIIAAMVVAFAFRFTPVAKRSFSTINPGAPISTTFVRSITGPGNRFGPSGGGRSSITGTNSDYRRARDARITLRRRKRSTSNLPQPRWLRIGVEKLFAKRVITSLLFVHRVERFGDLRLGVTFLDRDIESFNSVVKFASGRFDCLDILRGHWGLGHEARLKQVKTSIS